MRPIEPRLVLLGVILAYAVSRATELFVDARHERKLRRLGGTQIRPDGFWPIIAVQAIWFSGLLIEGVLAPGARPRLWIATYPFLTIAALALALRYWCIFTLGDRWTVRVWILPQPLVVGGPYRFLRHPNYLAVWFEYATIPLAFGLWFTAAITIPMGAASLLYRIRLEERALAPQRSTPALAPRKTT